MKNINAWIIVTLFAICGCTRLENAQPSTETKISMPDSLTGYASVNGIRMYYEIHGDGQPLVLLHGGGSTITSTFGHVLPLLAKDFKVIAVELQGHGRTSDRKSPVSFEQDADDVFTLLQNLGIPKASFFGFSNGGNDAMQIAMRHPDVVDKLILASTFYKREGFPQGFFDRMTKATLNDMPQPLKTAFLKVNADSSQLQTMFEKDRARMVQFKDWKDEDMKSIKAPTLLINGDHDVIQNNHVLVMAGLIPNSRIMILPASHGSYLGVAESPAPPHGLPEATVELITAFLNAQ